MSDYDYSKSALYGQKSDTSHPAEVNGLDAVEPAPVDVASLVPAQESLPLDEAVE